MPLQNFINLCQTFLYVISSRIIKSQSPENARF